MKVCNQCGDEIYTKEGVNTCKNCMKPCKNKTEADKRRSRRRELDAAMASVGMTRVKGALGGVYYE